MAQISTGIGVLIKALALEVRAQRLRRMMCL